MSNSSITQSGVVSFLPDFIAFMNQNDADYPQSSDKNTMTNDTFRGLLKDFLCTKDSVTNQMFKTKWGDSIKLYDQSSVNSLNCNTATKVSAIKAFTFMYTHRNYESSVGLIKGTHWYIENLKIVSIKSILWKTAENCEFEL